ncbi:SOS response-associated peptidase [Thalassococcus sp. BH17M4-6]|uniref:SOS response-associated peptidase n=1 Tax=Thalassococcus sp. BH17M4-6 TaxID=3413148 RepID=UPI003BC7C6A1
MPGRLFLTSSLARVAEAAGVEQTLDAEPPRRNIAPGQEVVTLGPEGLRRMRWGLIPQGRRNARGRPVMETIVNARSETLFEKSAFAGVSRCVVPADGWYEWTGAKGRKQPWAISDRDGGLLWFAAIFDIWVGPGGIAVPQCATVTCDPSGDVAEIHDRMGVLLSQRDLALWLRGDEAAVRPLMRPWPDGTLRVERAEGVDWAAS